MGSKYNSYSSDRDRKQPEVKVHPVWRGVGFAFMILIPVMSYAATTILLEQNNIYGWFIPTKDMLAKEGHLLYYLIPDPWIYIKIGLFLLCMIILFTIFMVVSFPIMGMFGINPKNDPFYVPPVRRTTPRTRGRRR
jgi:hypothetical protein